MASVEQPSVITTPEVDETPTIPAPVTVGGCESYRPLVSQYNWDANTALAIMKAESGCNSSAYNGVNYNGSNDAGLFQVNSIHVSSGLIGDHERFNPEANIKAAYAIYSGSGWSAWSVFNNQSYKKYL